MLNYFYSICEYVDGGVMESLLPGIVNYETYTSICRLNSRQSLVSKGSGVLIIRPSQPHQIPATAVQRRAHTSEVTVNDHSDKQVVG